MEEAVMLAEVNQRCKSNTHRIDNLEKRQDDLDKLTTTMSVMAKEQEHIKSDVGEIKSDVKNLTEKPGKRWDSIVEKLVWLAISGTAGYLAAQLMK